MATQFFVSGPAQFWIGTGGSFAWQYLGYTENGATVSITGLWEDIEVDYAARMPGDVSNMGQEIRISAVFTRYDEAVMKTTLEFIYGNVVGGGLTGSVGTLMVTEGGAYPLLVYSSYSFKSNYGNMVPGFYIPAAYVVDPEEVVLSVRRKAPSVSWRGIPIFGAYNGPTFVPGLAPFNAYELYTNTMPSPMPTPT